MLAMRRFTIRVVAILTFAATLKPCSSSCLYFAYGSNSEISVEKLDLSTDALGHTTMLRYPMGPYNPGGGATGICRLGNRLYWGDQTTVSLHSADLKDGQLTNHNPSFIANLTDPQGVACDASQQNVYVIDAIPGSGARGVFFRSPIPGSPVVKLKMVGGDLAYRSIKIVGGELWFGADSGLFRSEQQKLGSVMLEQVVRDGRIYEDFEVVANGGAESLIFASTYDWSGEGVLESELSRKHQNLTRPFRPMNGTGCQKGSELTWGLAADASSKNLYWVVNDDASHMKIMYKNYETSDTAAVAYSAIGSASGIYFDPEHSRTLVV